MMRACALPRLREKFRFVDNVQAGRVDAGAKAGYAFGIGNGL